MRLTFTALFIIIGFTCFGQKIKFFDADFRETDKKYATFYTITSHTNDKALEGIVKTFYIDGTFFSEAEYKSLATKRRDGLTKFFYNKGQIKTEITFKDGIVHGSLKSYFPNQQLKRSEIYENGNLVEATCFAKSGADTTYYPFQTEPQFPGGQIALEKYIQSNLKKGYYLKNGLSISAVAHFTVTNTGEKVNIEVPGFQYNYQKEAILKMLKEMPNWLPGTDDGELISKRVTIPFSFL